MSAHDVFDYMDEMICRTFNISASLAPDLLRELNEEETSFLINAVMSGDDEDLLPAQEMVAKKLGTINKLKYNNTKTNESSKTG